MDILLKNNDHTLLEPGFVQENLKNLEIFFVEPTDKVLVSETIDSGNSRLRMQLEIKDDLGEMLIDLTLRPDRSLFTQKFWLEDKSETIQV